MFTIIISGQMKRIFTDTKFNGPFADLYVGYGGADWEVYGDVHCVLIKNTGVE